MPELAAIFIAGVFANLVLTALFAFLWKHRYTTGSFITVSQNLRKSGCYWSENRERIIEGGLEAEEVDRASSLRSIWLTGSLLSLLSWVGLAFQLLLMISYRFLARSRIEKALLASPVAYDPSLQAPEIEQWIVRVNGAERA